MEKNYQETTSDINHILLDFERISLGENLYENIRCILCFKIPFSPLLFDCCENIICNQCYKSWSGKSNSCPLCRHEGSKVGIPNRFIKNIYASIKYFCSFKENGCQIKDLAFDSISKHEEICEFNPNRIIICEKCESKYKSNDSHDCLTFLLHINRSLTSKITSLEKEMDSFKKDKGPIINITLPSEYNYLIQTLKIHKHVLVKLFRKNGWRCNGCFSGFLKEFSYYCYECDFDCCDSCFKLSYKPPKNHGHLHELSIKNIPFSLFSCDNCKIKYQPQSVRYRCNTCDFDLCHKCRY